MSGVGKDFTGPRLGVDVIAMVKDLDQLLGGYATGTLTKDERETLFAAAVDNQQLFNALADEEALKELLEDPENRQHLLEVLEARPFIAHPGRLTLLIEWLRKPLNLTLAGSIVTAAVAVFVFSNLFREEPQKFAAPLIPETTAESPRDRRNSAQPKREPKTETASLPPQPPSTTTLDAELSHRVPEAPIVSPQMSDQAGAPRDFRGSRQFAETRYRFSLVQPVAQGPAQRLFYDTSNRETQPALAARPTAMRRSARQTKQSQQLAEEKSIPTPSEFAKRQATTTTSPRIGLKLTLEKEGPDGSYSGMKLDATFGQNDKLRLIVQANTNGYLYVVGAVDRHWRQISPSFGEPQGAPPSAGVQRGQQISIPLSLGSRFSQDPGDRKLFIVLSRDEIQELARGSMTAGRDAPLKQDIKDFLEGWRATNEKLPVILEEQADRTNYFVPSTRATTGRLMLELDVTRS